jgi:hypothetical protein
MLFTIGFETLLSPPKEAVEASIAANSPRREEDTELPPASEAAGANPWVTK